MDCYIVCFGGFGDFWNGFTIHHTDLDTQEFDLFIKDNVLAIFCFSSVIVIIYVSVLTSLLLYGRAYFSIAQSLILQNQKA